MESDSESVINLEDGIRCLFDSYTPTNKQTIKIQSADTCFELICAQDEDPGALQSGVYLWPASRALGEYLALSYFGYNKLNTMDEIVNKTISICELGAGCGLAGLAYSTLEYIEMKKHKTKTEVSNIILTDRDASLLEHMKNSIELNEKQQSMQTCRLVWGSSKEATENLNDLKKLISKNNEKSLQLILGTDLIYSTDIIPELFYTVHQLLQCKADGSTARFTLCSSFRHPDTTTMVKEQCEKYGIVRKVKYDTINLEVPDSSDDIVNTMKQILEDQHVIVEEFYF